MSRKAICYMPAKARRFDADKLAYQKAEIRAALH